MSAISARKLCCSYEKKLVLNECNLTVTKGHIYGLLGPMGCGKTTLLKCVLGINRLQSGDIRIFGEKIGSHKLKIPGSGVGYMPQDLALAMAFTIEESLTYYGKMHKLTQQEIESRIEFLMKRFEMPPKTQVLSTLSGGQQRRVALSVALMHSPPLLLLDEPTIGLDPLLKYIVWSHLKELSAQGITIIYTTCYNEEARGANTIGFMRNGKMMIEDDPERLLRKFQCDLLEQVSFKLSQLQNIEIRKMILERQQSSDKLTDSLKQKTQQKCQEGQRNHEDVSINKIEAKLSEKLSQKLNYFNFYQIPIIIRSNLILINRNFWAILIFYMFLPSFLMATYCLAIGEMSHDIRIAILNEENPPDLSTRLLEGLDERRISQVKFDDLDSAIDAIKRGEVWAALEISPNYTEAIGNRIYDGPLADNETLKDSSLKIYIDLTSPIVDFTILFSLIKSFESMIKGYLIEEGYSQNLISMPWNINEFIYGTDNPSVKSHNAPAILSIGFFFVVLTLAGFTVIKEKTEGVLERKLINGIGILEIMIAHLVTQSLLMLFQLGFLLTTTYYVFRVELIGSFIETIIIISLIGFSGITFAFFLASVCRHTVSLIVINFAVNFAFLFGSGIIWPVEAMPFIIKRLAQCMPITLPVEALKSIATRGWSVLSKGSTEILLGISVTIAMSTVFFIASVLFFKRHSK